MKKENWSLLLKLDFCNDSGLVKRILEHDWVLPLAEVSAYLSIGGVALSFSVVAFSIAVEAKSSVTAA